MAQGRLRIYLGAAPGVGKTVAMLNEGHRRASRGTDVVVGYCETHDRTFTASLLDGLDMVPRKKVDYHGTTLEEMDLDAILKRNPTVVLVDELAHSNAPGSKHEKRYQDVLDLLDAGINVISTLNIQHLESLNDAVTAITGVVQHETVPDEIVRSADQIDLVDMSPDALRRRMTHGHIYMPDQVNAALANYFRPGNLSALRELALLWMADKVEAVLEDYRTKHAIAGGWPVRERVVVALSGAPGGEALLRRGARIASRLAGGQMLAAYVAPADGLANAPVGTVAQLQEVTQQLGGEFHTIAGDDPTATLLDFARGVNATQILVGASTPSPWRRGFAPSFASQVIAEAGDIDVHVVSRAKVSDEPLRRHISGLSPRRRWTGLAAAIVLPAILTAIFLAIGVDPEPTVDIPLYMLVTVVAALLGGTVPAVVAALVSSLLLNWFFVAPVHALTPNDPSSFVALASFLIVGVLVSIIVHLSARRARQAVAAQRESAALAELAHSLLGTTEQMPLLLQRAQDMFGVTAAALLCPSAFGKPTVVESVGDFDLNAPADHEQVDDDHELALQPAGLSANRRRLFAAFAAHAEAILQREALAQTAATADRATRDNANRTALFSAISRDLRSPLASITAAAASIHAGTSTWSATDEDDFATIEHSVYQVQALIGNLLQLSLIQMGSLEANLTHTDLTNVFRRVAATSTDPERTKWSVADDARYVVADADLLGRALGNVLKNAQQRQPDDVPVVVTTSRIAERVEIRVVDRGSAVDTDDLDTVFRPKREVDDSGDDQGVDLKLAVARGLTETMDGQISAETTPGGGLTIVISLPAPAGAGD